MIEDALYARLLANAGVYALVGIASSPITARVYPLMIPQHVYSDATLQPCIVYTKDGEDRTSRLDGTDNVVAATFQIDSYARTHAGSLALADAVKDALIDFAGTVASVVIKHVTMENAFALVDPEPGLHRITQSFRIWFVDE